MWKKCTECGRYKALYMFYRQKNGKFGLRGQCKVCRGLYQKNERRGYFKQYRKNNKLLLKQCRLKSRDDLCAYHKLYGKKWRKLNPDKAREKTARYRASKLNQTPNLTQQEDILIKKYYKVSNWLGKNYEVDHEIPLAKGGLHHPSNLQILTKKDNLLKGAKLDYVYKHPRIRV